MTVSLDRTIAIGGVVIGLIGTGIVVLWSNKRWLGGVLVALGLIIALAAIVVWALTRSKRTDPDEAKLQELQRKLAELQALSPELRLQVDNGSDTCLIPRPLDRRPSPHGKISNGSRKSIPSFGNRR
jgi:MFS superfamily sulfate permease-like transporter